MLRRFMPGEHDPILDAMQAELKRSLSGLRVPGSPRPYYLLYALRRRRDLLLQAAHGSLIRRRDREVGSLSVDLRVGSHAFDNVMDGGLGEEASERESADWLVAPDDMDPMALRCALWKLTQLKFDEAQSDYYDHRKALVSEFLRDEVTSFTQERPTTLYEDVDVLDLPTEQLDAWAADIEDLSRRFLDHPEIHDPEISIRGERLVRWQIDSEGARIRTCDLWLEFEIRAWVLTDDGVYVESARSVPARRVEEVPSREQMDTLLDAVLDDLRELRESSESPAAFIGPALLSGQAASTVFHEALGHRLEGNRLVARGETRTFAHMLGERVLPEGLDVRDDPTLVEFEGRSLWGSYRVDDEGVPAQSTLLVSDGILVDFLRSRSPLPKLRGAKPETVEGGRSNGHGRGDGIERPMARMANLVVEGRPELSLTREALETELIALARAQGRRQVAVIHTIRAGETSTDSYDFQVFKGELARVEFIDVDTGERQRVRDLELIGTPLSALQKVVRFGGRPGMDHGYCWAESGSVPVAGISPAVLLSEVELQQASRTGFHEPLLPPPFADDGSRGRTAGLRGRGRRRKQR